MKTYYQFKYLVDFGQGVQYVTPCADPMEHEYPFDYIYDSVEAAKAGLIEILESGEFELDVATLHCVKYTTERVNFDLSDLIVE